MRRMQLREGEVFAGYTVLRLLGSGGMGEIYLVQHPRLPRRDALKVLPPTFTSDGGFRERFNREADIAASLWHPHIVSVHDRGEFNGQIWISMDYVEGTDAAQLLRGRYPHGMPADEALEIVTAVASALDHAHHEQLLHRDVKPANILLAESRLGQRRILLADFGIARKMDDISGLTQTNMTVGSVAYAAPEQLSGESIDGRADQYALACTAYHLLTGAPPFEHTNAAVVIGQHLTATPPTLSDRRPDLSALDRVFATAMSKAPLHRFSSCGDFAQMWRQRLHGGIESQVTALSPTAAAPVVTTPTVSSPESSRPRGGWRIAAGAVAIAAAVLIVGITAFVGARLAQRDSSNPPSSTPEASAPAATTVSSSNSAQTVTQPPVTVTAAPSPPPRTQASNETGDLGLTTPMSYPACNGTGIVVLGNAVTPGQYRAAVQRLLAAHPGASYLRTDQACPSLRQATETGNPIYAVYRVAGATRDEVCAAVNAAGGDAYGKWLDMTTDPRYIIPC
jgi:serine/threonine-protein kinase